MNLASKYTYTWTYANRIRTPLDWNFPSPTATPTTGSFGNNIFHTPKASVYPSHFQDAFTTPQMPTYATPQQPQFSSMTPVQRPQSSSETLRSNYYANIQSAGSQSGGYNMVPLVQMGQSGTMVSPTYAGTHAASMQLAMNTSFDSSQMQTPPPTRGTSVKKPQQAQHIAFGTPSTIASRRFMTPQQPVVSSNDVPLSQHTSMQFPQLQFSPDVYQFANFGPASAPVMPHSRVLWAQSGSPMQAVPTATLADPFAPGESIDMGWSGPGMHPMNVQTVSFDTPAMNSFEIQGPQPRPASAAPTPAASATLQSSSASVDPSLLYSSPVHPIVRSTSRSKKARPQAVASESQSKENAISSHAKFETVPSMDTVASRLSSNLQRSNTTGTARSVSATESLSRSNSINQIPRTASPAKRFGQPSLGSISEGRPRQRTSVILTVDENGRARTETRRLEDSPTRSIRERYPALFDSDSSDAESDSSEQIPSRPSSFIFDKRDERRSKAARLDPPVENLEGLSIPRSGSAASMKKGIPPSRAAVAAAAQLRRQGSLRRSTPSRNSLNRRSLIPSSTTSSIDTCPMDVSTAHQHTTGSVELAPDPDADGWAPREDRLYAPSSGAETALEAHNRRWSMMSFEQQHSQSISPDHQQYPAAIFPDFAVQTRQNPRPPQSRQLLVRCLCGVANDRGLPLIQCRSCTQWLHTPCVGLEGQVHPPNYTCFLCTRPASNMPRGIAR